MAKLLRANFARMWKSKPFWVCGIILFVLSLTNYLLDYFTGSCVAIEFYFFKLSNLMIFAVVFIALYLGTEHSCGTLRNKMTAGHTRVGIYFSNLIACLCATVMMSVFYCAPPLIVGLITGNGFAMEGNKFLLYAVVSLAACGAMTAICVLIAMLMTSKSMICTVTILVAFVTFMAAAIMMTLLNEPEYISNFEYTVNGGISQGEQEPNPLYVSGVKREIITVVNDILPTGQMIQVEANQPHNVQLMPLYSAGVLIAVTAAGAVVFKKKDIK